MPLEKFQQEYDDDLTNELEQMGVIRQHTNELEQKISPIRELNENVAKSIGFDGLQKMVSDMDDDSTDNFASTEQQKKFSSSIDQVAELAGVDSLDTIISPLNEIPWSQKILSSTGEIAEQFVGGFLDSVKSLERLATESGFAIPIAISGSDPGHSELLKVAKNNLLEIINSQPEIKGGDSMLGKVARAFGGFLVPGFFANKLLFGAKGAMSATKYITAHGAIASFLAPTHEDELLNQLKGTWAYDGVKNLIDNPTEAGYKSLSNNLLDRAMSGATGGVLSGLLATGTSYLFNKVRSLSSSKKTNELTKQLEEWTFLKSGEEKLDVNRSLFEKFNPSVQKKTNDSLKSYIIKTEDGAEKSILDILGEKKYEGIHSFTIDDYVAGSKIIEYIGKDPERALPAISKGLQYIDSLNSILSEKTTVLAGAMEDKATSPIATKYVLENLRTMSAIRKTINSIQAGPNVNAGRTIGITATEGFSLAKSFQVAMDEGSNSQLKKTLDGLIDGLPNMPRKSVESAERFVLSFLRQGSDPGRQAEMLVNLGKSSTSLLMDATTEFYRAGLLSSPSIPIKSFVANTLGLSYEATVDLVAGLISKTKLPEQARKVALKTTNVFKGERGVQMLEMAVAKSLQEGGGLNQLRLASDSYYTILGIKNSFKNVFSGLNNELVSIIKSDKTAGSRLKKINQFVGGSVDSKYGRASIPVSDILNANRSRDGVNYHVARMIAGLSKPLHRMSNGTLQFVDNATRAGVYEASFNKSINRLFANELISLKDKSSISSIVKKIIDTADSAAMEELSSSKYGNYLLSQAKKAGAISTITEIPTESSSRFSVPFSKFVFPFMTTASNVVKRVVKNSPLAFLSAEARTALSAGGDVGAEQLARIAVGSGAIASGLLFSENLFAGPRGGASADIYSEAGILKNSIKIGNINIGLNGLDPLGFSVMMGARINEMLNHVGELEKDDEDTLMSYVSEIGLTIARSFLDVGHSTRMGDALNEMNSGNISGAGRALKKLGASMLVPGAVAWGANLFNDFKGEVHDFMSALANRMGLAEDRLGVFGEPIPKNKRFLGVFEYSVVGSSFNSRALQFMLKNGVKPQRPTMDIDGVSLTYKEHRDLLVGLRNISRTGLSLKEDIDNMFDIYKRSQAVNKELTDDKIAQLLNARYRRAVRSAKDRFILMAPLEHKDFALRHQNALTNNINYGSEESDKNIDIIT